MNELIKITENDGVQTVSGRELHRILGLDSNYTTWFNRMCEYGFEENTDYIVCFPKKESESRGGQNMIDHIIKLDMAKEICMIQRTPIGKQIRQYFISVEKQWKTLKKYNDSYMIEDPVERASRWIEEQQAHQAEVKCLEAKIEVKDQQIAEMQPKASYFDVVINSPELLSTTAIAKDYGWSAYQMNKFLNNLGIQYKRGNRWYLYQKYADCDYVGPKTYAFPSVDGAIDSATHMYWTQKGRLFIYETLKAQGIVPTMERPKQIELSEYNFGEYWS